jgi:hypothetical protein
VQKQVYLHTKFDAHKCLILLIVDPEIGEGFSTQGGISRHLAAFDLLGERSETARNQGDNVTLKERGNSRDANLRRVCSVRHAVPEVQLRSLSLDVSATTSVSRYR